MKMFVTINEEKYPVLFSLGVSFDIGEKYGSVNSMLQKLSENDRQAFDVLADVVVRMVNEAGGNLDKSAVSKKMTPWEFSRLRDETANAITYAYKREIPSPAEEEVDLGLQELNEKK